MVGRTFPRVGSLAVGGYYGLNDKLFLSSRGEPQRSGLIGRLVLAGHRRSGDRPDPLHLGRPERQERLRRDRRGVYFYVTPAVDVLTGPVFFFDGDLQPGGSSWMWSMQVDVDINLLGK